MSQQQGDKVGETASQVCKFSLLVNSHAGGCSIRVGNLRVRETESPTVSKVCSFCTADAIHLIKCP